MKENVMVSPDFTGDRFEDRRRIVPLRRKIDSRIEPIPFRPEDFYDGGMLVEEIKRTGIDLFFVRRVRCPCPISLNQDNVMSEVE